MKKIIFTSVLTFTLINAAAYKLPEQSIDGLALGEANVANCQGADCAYYNPANMSFLQDNKNYLEAGITYVYLPKIEFIGNNRIENLNLTLNANAKSKQEHAIAPFIHYVSKPYGKIRYGFSITVPGGLSKRWESRVQKLYAQEFTLKTLQFNPSISYKINDNFSVAAGVSVVYSEGKVYSDVSDIGLPLKREMKGDSIDYGFNIAAIYKLNNGINLAATYRSEIKLSEEGKANLYFGNFGKKYDASVNVYLPATLTLAVSKKFEKFSIELLYERNFWSSYKTLDFNYKGNVPTLLASFDEPIAKNWKDTDTFRIGLKYFYSDKLTLMAGYSYDESPVPSSTLSYELPDSNAHIFSAGFKYKQNENLSWGAAILYDYKKKRYVKNAQIDGEFKKGGALLITTGFEYKF
jgi:long-chain fatty acid transport protein